MALLRPLSFSPCPSPFARAIYISVQVANLDAVIVPVGGGGLISGISTAVKGLNPNCKVIGAEPLNVFSLNVTSNRFPSTVSGVGAC